MRSSRTVFIACLTLGACAQNPLPPPNSIRASFDRSAQVIQFYVSNAVMPGEAWLVDANGSHIAVPLTLVSGPHVIYTAPPTIGLGLGVFGWNVGGGTGIGVPLGSPRPSSVDDQFVAAAKVAGPPDYLQHWSQYRLQVAVGPQAFEIPAPSPTAS